MAANSYSAEDCIEMLKVIERKRGRAVDQGDIEAVRVVISFLLGFDGPSHLSETAQTNTAALPHRGWWCPECRCAVQPERVTYWETHDERYGGCGHHVQTNAAAQGERESAMPVTGKTDPRLSGNTESAGDIATGSGKAGGNAGPATGTSADNSPSLHPASAAPSDDKRETPRTDNACDFYNELGHRFVIASHAERLERELNASREDLDRLTRGTWSKELARLSAANASLREELNAARSAIAPSGAVIRFLLGEEPLDGVWFGDLHPKFTGRYWWRAWLRSSDSRSDPK